MTRRHRLLAFLVTLVLFAGWPWIWCPARGLDRGHNALWLSHGWLGGSSWFAENNRLWEGYRGLAAQEALAERLDRLNVGVVYPHLCPTDASGHLPEVDPAQVEGFAQALPGVEVLPWIGGVNGRHVFLRDSAWRATFVAEAAALVRAGGFAGVHLNIEPLPSGDADYLSLLEELKTALPAGKRLSVAAYPPQVLASQVLEVHWTTDYFTEVAERSDELAVMTYDSGLWLPGPFALLVARWSQKAREAAGSTDLFLGVPTYDDEVQSWHKPIAENLRSGLAGLGLVDGGAGYRGVAIYANWELDEKEVGWLEEVFVEWE